MERKLGLETVGAAKTGLAQREVVGTVAARSLCDCCGLTAELEGSLRKGLPVTIGCAQGIGREPLKVADTAKRNIARRTHRPEIGKTDRQSRLT